MEPLAHSRRRVRARDCAVGVASRAGRDSPVSSVCCVARRQSQLSGVVRVYKLNAAFMPGGLPRACRGARPAGPVFRFIGRVLYGCRVHQRQLQSERKSEIERVEGGRERSGASVEGPSLSAPLPLVLFCLHRLLGTTQASIPHKAQNRVFGCKFPLSNSFTRGIVYRALYCD